MIMMKGKEQNAELRLTKCALFLSGVAADEQLPDYCTYESVTGECEKYEWSLLEERTQKSREQLKKLLTDCCKKMAWVGEQILADNRGRIFKLLMSPRIDSKEPIPPGYKAWRAGTTALLLLGS
jgi:hypothetical protein